MKRTVLSLLPILAALLGGLAWAGAARVEKTEALGVRALPSVLFTAADGSTAALAVEVADDGREQTCGLMYRTEMPDDQAMLFVSSDRFGFGPFWNKNTFLPLSVAYIAGDGTIVDIVDMAPIQPDEYPTTQQPRIPPGVVIPYVIEANQGWYGRHGIGAGDHTDVAEAVLAADAAAPPPVAPC